MAGFSFVVLAFWQLIGIASAIYTPLLGVYLGAPLVVIALLIADKKTLPNEDNVVMTADIPRLAELGSEHVLAIRLRVSGYTAPPTDWKIMVRNVETFTILSAPFVTKAESGEGATLLIRLPTLAKRLGVSQSMELTFRTPSLFRLFWREFSYTSELRWPEVTPSTEKIPSQMFERVVQNNRSFFLGSRIRVPTRSPDQPHSVRKYQYPDSFRFIDHKKSARYGELMTRTYDNLTDSHLIIALDVGRAMAGAIGESEKIAFYLSAACKLVEHAISARERVSFFAFAQDIPLTIPKRRRADAFQPLYKGHPLLRSRSEESDYGNLTRGVASLGAQRSAVIVLTDVTRPSVQKALLEPVRALTAKHLTLVVGLVDSRFDVDERVLAIPDDGRITKEESTELIYSYWLREEFDSFAMHMSRIGGGLVTVPEKYWLDMVSRSYQIMRQGLF